MISTDKRWKELGRVITHYCLDVQPGNKVMIAQYEIESWPLALATYESVIKAGGFPQIQLKSEYLRRAFMKCGTEKQYGWVPEIELKGMEWADERTGGVNQSIIHWDIVKDLRKEGELTIDGKPILKNGELEFDKL